MGKLLFKPPTPDGVHSHLNDDGSIANFLVLRCYLLSKFSRLLSLFPAASLLCGMLIEKVEGVGEYDNGY